MVAGLPFGGLGFTPGMREITFGRHGCASVEEHDFDACEATDEIEAAALPSAAAELQSSSRGPNETGAAASPEDAEASDSEDGRRGKAPLVNSSAGQVRAIGVG